MRQLLLDITQAPAPTFENFVPGRNAEPLAAVRAALAGLPERVLYLWGETGAGKTSIISEVTGDSRAVIGSGFKSCTATSRPTISRSTSRRSGAHCAPSCRRRATRWSSNT